jgi:hypothetical protein
LGPRTYLEIVGPVSGQPAPHQPRWFNVDSLREPRLVTWAASAAAIEELAARAKHAGVALGPLGTGRRTRADGVGLAWRFTDPATVVCDGIVPFLIDWGTSPHPALTAPDGGVLLSLRADIPILRRSSAACERSISTWRSREAKRPPSSRRFARTAATSSSDSFC